MPMEPSPPSLKHELRTPLNHIIGYCEMLIEEAKDQASAGTSSRSDFKPDLLRIHSAGRRLLGVVNELFDDSIPNEVRFDGFRLHHEIRTPLNQIIGYAEMLQEEASEHNDTACAADLAKIRDAAQCLLNLVLTRFGGAGFPTTDPGRGPEDLNVAILHKDDCDGPPEAFAHPKPRLLGSILIADDDAANREMLSRRLERIGHTVSSAATGREVVELIRAGEYDLLLLDIVMPDLDGYAVLEYLRANPPAKSMPVIVLSASDESWKIARCIRMGAQDYLPKPFDPALLQARIESSLEKKRLRDREAVYLAMIKKEKERADDLLHIILPSNIASELKSTGDVRPRRIDNVAVLFADVVGFTSYCESRDPETVHRELQSLVKEMEAITTGHGMEKIKTIGDAFLSAAGLQNQFGNPLIDCVRCGLTMIAKAAHLPVPWKLRVGVHSGPVVAGIVGRLRYQYDIWGDTVNAAARMQAEAPPGTLCVTTQTWKQLETLCLGVSLGFREIKGKGKHEVFEVQAVRD